MICVYGKCFLFYRDENAQVHGSAMLGDHTGSTLKHMMRFPIEDIKTFIKSFQVIRKLIYIFISYPFLMYV